MIVVRDPAALRRWVREQRARGERVGFVPTMGALHEGHLRLVDRAAAAAEHVICSVFVNPLQFGPGEDFEAYPRDEQRDCDLLAARGVAAVFVPSAAVMYPDAPRVRLVAPDLIRTLCGPHRPGHFEGVLTVVAKLLHIVEPDVAVFGRKDAQQALLIRRMTRDLDFPVTIDVAPTVREPDGLALSSRNAYLDPAGRRSALVLSRALEAGHRAWAGGVADAGAIVEAVRQELAREPGFAPQYVELVDQETLAPRAHGADDALLAAAGHVGVTRLIDNILLGAGLAGDVRVA